MKITIEDTTAGEPSAVQDGAPAIDAGAPPAWLFEAISTAGGTTTPVPEQIDAAPTDAGAARLG